MTKAWAENKSHILAYYETKKLPLNQVMIRMAQHHNFHASQRAYRQQFHNWGIAKYNRKERPLSRDGDERAAAPVQKARVSSSSSISCPRIYVTNATRTQQDATRPSHAHISHSDRAHSMSDMPSQYQELVTSPYPSPIPTPTSSFHDDGPIGHTRHNGVIQTTVGRESPSSFLFLQPADGISAMKSAPWPRRQDTQKHYSDSSDYKNAYSYPEAFGSSGGYDESSMQRKSSDYAWSYTNSTHAGPMELDSHNDHKRESSVSPVSTHDDRTSHAAYQYPAPKLAHSPSAFSDYSSDYHQSTKSFYGYQEHDLKQRVWGTSEATPATSATTFETRRYTSMPSPPHSQGHPSSPRATKSMEEQLTVPRTLPLSPASVPDQASSYNPDSLPATMDFPRTYNPAYTTRSSPIQSHPSPHEVVASPVALSTPCHPSMYPSSHLG